MIEQEILKDGIVMDRIQRDGIYGTGAGEPLTLDWACPSVGEGPFPAIVCIHGGGWHGGERQGYHWLLQTLSGKGYVAATVSYRVSPKHKFPAHVEDVKCAVRFLRAHADTLRVDPDRVGAVGESAGGHLALMLGVTAPSDGLEGHGGWQNQSSQVRAVVNYYGVTDFKNWVLPEEGDRLLREGAGLSLDQLIEQVLGTCDRDSRVVAQASPVTYIGPGTPPILTFQGALDPVVPLSQAQILHDALRQARVEEELVVLDHAGHGFGPEEAKLACGKMIAFFDRHLKGVGGTREDEASP